LLFGELLKEIQPSVHGTAGNIEIRHVTDDSRKCSAETIFVLTEQGKNFAADAFARGCRLVLLSRERFESINPQKDAVYLISENVLSDYGKIASALAGHPSRKMRVVGVTGTNGKTTITHMLYHIWKENRIPGGLIGTLGVKWSAKTEVQKKTGYTTPRPDTLHAILREMLDDGITHVAMEVSSEALALGRLEAVHFSAIAFTNLTTDHLDFHGNMENYFRAKMLLFDMAASSASTIAVYTGNEPGRRAYEYALSIGAKAEAFDDAALLPVPTDVKFNKINGTLAAVISGVDRLRAAASLSTMPEVPGRFNRIPVREGVSVIVDYAHTPDALENVLGELRKKEKWVGCVFGCGGNRDSGKRPLMGEIAGRLCDLVIVTDDNPRKEDAPEIRGQILSGAQKKRAIILEIGDRRQAIRRGLEILQEKDEGVLLIAGKGHETVQIFADRTEPFSDGDEVRLLLEK